MNFFKDKKTYSLDRIEELVENYTGIIDKDKKVQTAITNLESTYDRNQNVAGVTAGVGVIGIFGVMATMSAATPLAIPLITASTIVGFGGVAIAGINKFYRSHLESSNLQLQDNISTVREEIINSLEKLGMAQKDAFVATEPESVVNNNLLDRIKNVRKSINVNIDTPNVNNDNKDKLKF
jgi:hypothetical protein